MSRELAALIRMGKSAYGEMDFLRAERLLREAVAGGAKYADIYYTLGLIEHQRGNFRQAVERHRPVENGRLPDRAQPKPVQPAGAAIE